jgi:hypothetical protein
MKEKIPKSKILVLASIVAITFVVSILLIQNGEAEIVAYDGPPKAVIIDQLYDEMPNEFFHQKATEYLEAAGYEVDIFTTKDVTLGFYKTLPEKNYKMVVVRTHGVTDSGNEKSLLFLGERYSEDRYITEQLLGNVEKATPFLELNFAQKEESSQWVIVNDTYRYKKTPVKVTATNSGEYFAIGPKFVNDVMSGEFSDTVFLLGGCSTAKNPSLVNSLISRGASSVVGWDDTTSSGDNDRYMLMYLKETLVNKMEEQKAVDYIMERYDMRDHKYYSNLKYYQEKI